MKRVNGTGQTYRLSADEYALLCLVDGETTMEEAAAHSRRLFGGRGGRDALRSLLAIIEFGDLGERPLVDEELLARILRG